MTIIDNRSIHGTSDYDMALLELLKRNRQQIGAFILYNESASIYPQSTGTAPFFTWPHVVVILPSGLTARSSLSKASLTSSSIRVKLRMRYDLTADSYRTM